MVNQFAQGDRNARRDLIDLAYKLGVDLTAGHGDAGETALETTITADDATLVAAFLERQRRQDDHSGDELNRLHSPSDRAEMPDRNENE